MRKLLLSFTVSLIAFLLGTFSYNAVIDLTDFFALSEPTDKTRINIELSKADLSEADKTISVSASENLSSPNNRFKYPDPIYKFPTSGIYFAEPQDPSAESDFQFEFDYQTHYLGTRTKKIRNVTVFADEVGFSEVPAKIDGYEISFETEKIKGVSYRFRGRFTNEEYLESKFNDQVVLTGVLQKIKDGKMLFERSLKFTYGVGC